MSYQDVKVPAQKGPQDQPISRILSSRSDPAWAIICLGCASQRTSVQPTRDSSGASCPLSLLGLAPGGGCLAAHIAARAGGLLHHHFTLTAHM